MAKFLPDPAELAEKTRAMMKPVPCEKAATPANFWTEHRSEILTGVAVAATCLTVGIVVRKFTKR